MHVGFTGTQDGMTERQLKRLQVMFEELFKTRHELVLHHGDCIGADLQAHALFHDLAVEYQTPSSIVIHPPIDSERRAFADKARLGAYTKIPIQILTEKGFLARNLDIVRESEVLYAAPRSIAEVRRSGTWSTCRKARAKGTIVLIAYPNGDYNSDWV